MIGPAMMMTEHKNKNKHTENNIKNIKEIRVYYSDSERTIRPEYEVIDDTNRNKGDVVYA